MAELASGAVHTLLGVIRNEAQLLGRVRNDVQFIREEMESMNSFLHYLARTTPPGGEHNAQVRTWMKQVRDLACECSNCIEIYLRRRDPSVYRARGLLGYVWWLPWFVKKLFAQRLVATQIHELKNRAREVGERRLRYGVEVPAKADVKKLLPTSTQFPGASQPAAAAVAALERSDHGLEDDDDQAAREVPRRELAFSESNVLWRCAEKLLNWLRRPFEDNQLRAVAIAAPDEEVEDIRDEVLNHFSFEHTLWVTPGRRYWVLGPLEALRWILRELQQESESVGADEIDEKIETMEDEIDEIENMEDEIDEKIKMMEEKIKDHLQEAGNKLGHSTRVEPLGVFRDSLQDLLQEDATAGKSREDQDQTEEKILEGTAEKMKKYLEPAGEKGSCCWIGLQHLQYVDILRELLPKPKQAKQTEKVADKASEDQIVKNIKEITLKIQVHILPELLKPQQDKSAPKEAPDQSGEDQMSTQEEIEERIKGTLGMIKERLLIQLMQETAEKIKEHLQGKRTLIFIDLRNIYYAYKWGETMEALSKLGCAAGSAVVVITKYIRGAAEFCYPTGEEVEEQPIICSSIQFYHDIVLQLTDRHVNHDEKYDANIFRDILLKCKSRDDEFCIKMFVRALYANPNRSKGELDKLSDTLVFGGSSDINGNKMIKFSYNDLLRDYKTCLLYLVIFPRDQEIRRSSLVGRWVAEGLITEVDWPSSVRQAERCFDALVDRWLVDPCDIDAAGKVKSCKLHHLVHDFITKIAKKEHITDTRLSHNWARHFSILSNIRLRPSDSIAYFLEKPSRASSQLKLLKVLDLEDCECLRNNEHYLKNICNTIILLKYLSLRNTGITELPKEINRLHQLEVLDIRQKQTAVRASATKHLMLLKLKRLLASRIDQSTTSTDVGASRAKASFSTVRVPNNIGKMTDMEALSYVQASKHCASELRDIGHLWQLRKLGVVIHDWKAHLENLLKAISDLNESLRSLSIEIKPPPGSEVATTPDIPSDALNVHLQNPPKLLESLSISGITMYGRLLPLLAKARNKLAKVTLHNSSLNQDDMEALAELANLRGLRLRHVNLHTESKLTFETDWFKNLKYLVVEGSNITDISFETEATPKLEKIVWTFTNIESFSGINNLPKLKELEFNGDNVPDLVMQAVEDHPSYIACKLNGELIYSIAV